MKEDSLLTKDDAEQVRKEQGAVVGKTENASILVAKLCRATNTMKWQCIIMMVKCRDVFVVQWYG